MVASQDREGFRRASSRPTISTGYGTVFTCQTASLKAPSAIGSLGYFSASATSFGACSYLIP